MKKIVLFLLAMFLVSSNAVAMNDNPFYDFAVDDLRYRILDSGNEVALTSGIGVEEGYGSTLPEPNIVVPSTVTYNGYTYTVTAIDAYTFFNTPQLVSITFPETLTSIGEGAFCVCTNLVGPLDFPESLLTIAEGAFSGCTSLQGAFTLPKSLTSLGLNAFVGCDGITSVNYNCANCVSNANIYTEKAIMPASLTELVFGDSVKQIPANLAYGCSALTSLTIPNAVESIGSKAFYGCTSVTTVNWNAKHCTIANPLPASCAEINIGDEVEFIPNSMAEGTKITSIVITANVTTIIGNTFRDCSQLVSATFLNNSITTLPGQLFENCSQLQSVNIPSSVTTVSVGVFRGCSSLTSVDIPSSVTTISFDAFMGCSSLRSIFIPASVTSIRSQAFYECGGLASIEVEAGNTVYDSRGNCNAIIESASNTLMTGCRNTVIPNTVVTIGQNAFAQCTEMTQMAIPSSVTSISNAAFSGCSGLTEITIPQSVTTIANMAFANCTGLIKITSLAQRPPSINSDNHTYPDNTTGTFLGVSKQTPVYVPKGSQQLYWVAQGWNEFANIYELEEQSEPNKCDVNGDGIVDIADVNAVINAMLGKER